MAPGTEQGGGPPRWGQVCQEFGADIHTQAGANDPHGSDLCIGEVPVLVGSALCNGRPHYTTACYFIVNGQCKVIVSQAQGPMRLRMP